MQASGFTQAGLYNDINQIKQIRVKNGNTQEGLKAVAQQFEAIYVNQMMQSMRKAERIWAEDNPWHSQEKEFFQDMLDNQLSVELSQKRGLGIADMLIKQLSHHVEASNVSAPNPFENSNLQSNAQTPMSQFIDTLLPYAQAAADRIGVDVKVLIAQAALETGWGQSSIKTDSGKESHNLFGIKQGSDWVGEVAQVNTHEYNEQHIKYATQDSFRVYVDYAQAFDDYADLITNSARYQQARAQADAPETYLKALQAAGYATDPDYADKVLTILNSDSFNP